MTVEDTCSIYTDMPCPSNFQYEINSTDNAEEFYKNVYTQKQFQQLIYSQRFLNAPNAFSFGIDSENVQWAPHHIHYLVKMWRLY
jgi:hypothetical protein